MEMETRERTKDSEEKGIMNEFKVLSLSIRINGNIISWSRFKQLGNKINQFGFELIELETFVSTDCGKYESGSCWII